MKVKYVGPFDAVELDGFGVVSSGAIIEVPDTVAGHPPADRVEVAHAELAAATAALDHELCKALREEIIGLDHGAGLLAQVSNWQAVKAAPKPKDEVPA